MDDETKQAKLVLETISMLSPNLETYMYFRAYMLYVPNSQSPSRSDNLPAIWAPACLAGRECPGT